MAALKKEWTGAGIFFYSSFNLYIKKYMAAKRHDYFI